MNTIMQVGRLIVPEAMVLLERRFNILRTVSLENPVGRRLLAQKTGLTERITRAETDFLKSRNLIDIQSQGMMITEQGQKLLEILDEVMQEFLGFEQLAELISQRLHFSKVLIVPGDSDRDPEVLEEMGRTAASLLASAMKEQTIVALTGGNTVKKMVDRFPENTKYQNVTVVSARGSLGKNYEIQSNTLVGRLADKIGGTYRSLNLPDNLSAEALVTMLREQDVSETVDLIKRAGIVVAGVGAALAMAKRRSLPESVIEELQGLEAEGEFFGSYYNQNGKIVKESCTPGLTLQDAKKAKKVFILAGGSSKAKPILSVDFEGMNATLITDEGAARKLIEIS